MNYLANILTVLSLGCGFASLFFSVEYHFTFAAWSIILSVVLDGLDGQIAKRISKPSEFGKELDSLVDVIAFGVAPSLLGYIFIYNDFYLWAIAALFFYLVCSVMRLAKYNITPKEKLANYFYGLPTTISGGILASFVLMYRKGGDLPLFKLAPFTFLMLVIFLAFLMISRIKYLNLDGLEKLAGKNLKNIIVVFAVFFSVAAYFRKAGTTLFTIFSLYVILSPLIVKRFNNK